MFANVRGTVALANNTAGMMRKIDPSVPGTKFTAADFDLEPDYFGGEYGRVTPEGRAAVELMKKTEGIKLETTYTGKTLAAMLDFVKRDKSLDGAPVLFWNTYNSVDFSRELAGNHDYTRLPGEVQWCFGEKLAECLKED
jgi:D-cysteine desulfhydrase